MFWRKITQIENTKERCTLACMQRRAALRFIENVTSDFCWRLGGTMRQKSSNLSNNLPERERASFKTHWKSLLNDSQLHEWMWWLWPEKEQFPPNTVQLFANAKGQPMIIKWLQNTSSGMLRNHWNPAKCIKILYFFRPPAGGNFHQIAKTLSNFRQSRWTPPPPPGLLGTSDLAEFSRMGS